MTDATLTHFRQIADVLAGPEPQDWQWIGPHISAGAAERDMNSWQLINEIRKTLNKCERDIESLQWWLRAWATVMSSKQW